MYLNYVVYIVKKPDYNHCSQMKFNYTFVYHTKSKILLSLVEVSA
jgi:hypothetical protein